MNKVRFMLFAFNFIVHFANPNVQTYGSQLENDSIFIYQYNNDIDTIKFVNNFSKIIIQPSDNKRKAIFYPSGLNEAPQDIIIGKDLIIISTDQPKFLNSKWIELRFFGSERILKISYLNNVEKFNMLPEVPILETDIHYPIGLDLRSDIFDNILAQEKKRYKNSTISFENEMLDFQEFISFYSEYSDLNDIPFILILHKYLNKYPIDDKNFLNSYKKLLSHLKVAKDYSSYRYLNKLIKKSKH